MQRYTCVLFDLDNTLIDSDSLIRRALEQSGCCDVDSIPESDLRSLSPNELLRRLERPDCKAEYWHHYRKLVRSEVALLDPETPDVLSMLSGRGIALGLVTSTVKDIVDLALGGCGIADHFAACSVTYGTCKRRKPHPDPILKALEFLDHPTTGTIYVGDAERDALASKSAGIHFGVAGWANRLPPRLATLCRSVTLRSVTDLLPLTEKD